MREPDKTKEELINGLNNTNQNNSRLNPGIKSALTQTELSENGGRYYQLLAEAAQDFIFIIGNDWCIEYVNSFAARHINCSPSEIIGKKLSEIFPPEISDQYKESLKRVFDTGELINVEKQSHFPGRTIWLNTTLVPIRDDKEKVSSVLGISRDITERKKTEEALIESEAKYRNLVENSLEGIGISKGNSVVYANRTLLDIFGYESMEEFLKIPLIDHVASDSKPLVQERLKKRESGEPLPSRFEYRIICKNGAIKDIEISSSEIFIGSEKYVQSTFRDITEHKRKEKALSESEGRYRSLVETSPYGITLTDLEGNIIMANPQALALHGYNSVEEIIGKSAFDFIAQEDWTRAKENLQRTLETGYIKNVEYTLLRKDDTSFPAEMSASLITDDEGKPRAFIGVVRDITERKESEKRISMINECFLSLGADPLRNINSLTALCGKLLKADSAMYNCIEDGLLRSMGKWNTPVDFELADKPEGHICYDVIKRKRPEILIVRDLEQSPYAQTSPLITRYKLKTYIGCPVKFSDKFIGTLCAVYTKDVIPSSEDKKILTIIASSIAVEEERRRTNKVLKAERNMLRTLIDNLPDYIYVKDIQSRFIISNSAVARVMGAKNPDEIIGKTDFDFYPKEMAEKYFQDEQKIISSGEPLINKNEPVIDRIDNKKIWVLTTKVPLRDSYGNITGIVGMGRDISELKKIEEALREEERFLSNIFMSIQDGISILDKALNIVQVNSAMEKWYAYNMPLAGKKCYEAYHSADKPCRICPALRTLETSCAAYEVVPKRQKDGEITGWLDLYTFPMFDMETGELKGVIEYVRDITERKKAEEALSYRAEFEKLITSISTNFINIPLNEVDNAINLALKKIGEFSKIDRSYVFLAYDDATKADETHEWCAEGITSEISKLKGLSEKEFPWVAKTLKDSKIVYVPSLNKLPPEASEEKEFWQSRGLKSVICVPMFYAGKPIGFLGFDSIKEERTWTDESIMLLKIVGEIFANALERKRAQQESETLNNELLKSNKKLKQLTLRDSHTGLYNHRYLGEIIEAEFYRSKRYGHSLSAIMLDVDYFKSINDVYGHQFGDLVLKQLARQLKRMLRQYDIVIRYGGEEFVIISPGTDRSTILVLAQRLLDAISLYNFGNKKYTVKLKLSLAVASYPEDKINRGMDLIELTDQVLSKVKEFGGNKVYSSIDLSRQRGSLDQKSAEDANIKSLKEKIEKLTKRANQSLIEAVFAFAKTIELKDRYTGQHTERTVRYATEIARMLDLPKEEIDRIRQASVLHDLGKIGISEKILLKRLKLSKGEFNELKKHPQIGADIIRPIQSLHDIIPLILYHHEHWDGKGYPNSLKGEEIPIGARIVAIADVYQALTSKRPYRKAYPKKEAIKIIKNNSGSQFDPRIVQAFLKILKSNKDQ